MPRWTPVERLGEVGMLKANVTSLVIAQQFRCHARTIECLKKRFWQIGTSRLCAFRTSPCNDVTSRLINRRSQLFNQFCPVTTPGTHKPRISAQTVTKCLQEIGERPLYMFYMRRFVFGLVHVYVISTKSSCAGPNLHLSIYKL